VRLDKQNHTIKNLKMNNQIALKRVNIKIIGILLITIGTVGCAALGTKTISKSNNLNAYEINNIGYSQIANEDNLNKIRPNTSNLYQSTLEDFFTKNSIQTSKYNLSSFESFEDIDKTEIIKLCSENGLDGFICGKIKYKFVNNYYMYIPLGKSEDAYVEIQLYDKNGLSILHTKHNTSMGNSYMMPPKAEQTIRDGTLGALKQIMKELIKNHL